MINMSTLTTALHAKLTASAALAALGLLAQDIERSTRINFDPARCPWIGVYPDAVSDVPRTLSAWKTDVGLQVVVQTASFSSDGTAASDALEGIIKAVLDVVTADLTLGVAGVRVIKFGREYRYVLFDDDGSGSVFMPQAIIKVGLEVRA